MDSIIYKLRTEKATQIFVWIVLLAGMAVFCLPYLFMISNSFETFSYVLPSPPRLFPQNPKLDAYKYVLERKEIVQSMINSTVITVMTVIFGIALSSLSAFAFARIKFIGRELVFKVYLFTLMIPGFLGIIPQFIILNQIKIPGLFENGMTGTRAGLVLLYIGAGICGNTFFLRGFFSSIPNEIEESVIIDGGSYWSVYWHIMMPLSKPALGTIAIMVLQGTWEEFFTARVILGGKVANMTLPMMLQRLQGQHATRWEWTFAASILMQLPILILFVVFQKKFVVSGLSEGSIKA